MMLFINYAQNVKNINRWHQNIFLKEITQNVDMVLIVKNVKKKKNQKE